MSRWQKSAPAEVLLSKFVHAAASCTDSTMVTFIQVWWWAIQPGIDGSVGAAYKPLRMQVPWLPSNAFLRSLNPAHGPSLYKFAHGIATRMLCAHIDWIILAQVSGKSYSPATRYKYSFFFISNKHRSLPHSASPPNLIKLGSATFGGKRCFHTRPPSDIQVVLVTIVDWVKW